MVRIPFLTAAVALAVGGLLAACEDMNGGAPSASGKGANASSTSPDTTSGASTNRTSPSTNTTNTMPDSSTTGSQNPTGPGPH